MQHQAMHKFLETTFYTSDSSWMLHPVLVVFALWAGAAPLLGIYDIWELSINIGIGIIVLSVVYVFRHARKHNAAMLHLTLQEFIDTNQPARSITLHDLTNEQIGNLRSELRSLCDRTMASPIEQS